MVTAEMAFGLRRTAGGDQNEFGHKVAITGTAVPMTRRAGKDIPTPW
jgi:hypothetical protein